MKVQSDRERAISDFAWSYSVDLLRADDYRVGLVDAGTVIVASTATRILVRLWEVFIWQTPDKNLEGIGIPAQLQYAEHKFEFEWPSAMDCEELTGSSVTCDYSPFDAGADVSWDDARYSDKSIRDALSGVDEWTLGDDLLEHWGQVDKIDWSRYPARLRPFLWRCASEAMLSDAARLRRLLSTRSEY